MLKRLLILSLILPQMTQAHVGHHGEGSALWAGLSHPLGGLDHLLAMVAVGIWGAAYGGAARGLLPLGFMAAMILGAGLGLAGMTLPLVEPMILASSVVIGLILALALRPGLLVAMGTTAVFGLMHGYAHGAEAPASGLMAYGFGFLLATAALHLAGLLLGRLGALRWLGAATAVAGLALALG